MWKLFHDSRIKDEGHMELYRVQACVFSCMYLMSLDAVVGFIVFFSFYKFFLVS